MACFTKHQFFTSDLVYFIIHACALAAPSGLWHLTFAPEAIRKSFFFHRDHVLGSLDFTDSEQPAPVSFSYSKARLNHTISEKIFKTSSPNGATSESKTIHIPPLHSKLGSLLFSTITPTEAQHYKKRCRRESWTRIFPFLSWQNIREAL